MPSVFFTEKKCDFITERKSSILYTAISKRNRASRKRKLSGFLKNLKLAYANLSILLQKKYTLNDIYEKEI